MLWFGLPGGGYVGAITVALGIAGVTSSACIYRVPSRPAWNTRYTLLQFNLTAAVLGPLFAAVVGGGSLRWLAIGATTMAGAQFVLLALRLFRCISSDSIELRGTARLLSTVLKGRLLLRGVLLAVTDEAAYSSARTAMTLIRGLLAEASWDHTQLMRLFGHKLSWSALQRGVKLERIIESYQPDIDAFLARREPALLYPMCAER